MLVKNFLPIFLFAVSLPFGATASRNNKKDKTTGQPDLPQGKITQIDRNESPQMASAGLVALRAMSIPDFANTQHKYNSKIVLDDLADVVDPDGKLDACGRAKNARQLLAKLAEAYTDDRCKWSTSPVTVDGKDPCFLSYGGRDMFNKVTNGLMDMLVQIDRLQFQSLPPQQRGKEWDGKRTVKDEIFRGALDDAVARATHERKLIIPVLQKALTIVLRTRSRTTVANFMQEQVKLDRYRGYLQNMDQIAWAALVAMIERIDEDESQYRELAGTYTKMIEDALKLLPLNQRNNDLSPAELACLQADGSWPILKDIILAKAKIVEGTGKDKLHPLKLARMLDDAAFVAIFGLGEELRQLKEAMIGYARKQIDPNSDSEWQKRVLKYEVELEDWETERKDFGFLIEAWVQRKHVFPVDINVSLLDNIAANQYSILEGINYYQIDMLEEIDGLRALESDKDRVLETGKVFGFIPIELRAQAKRQIERLSGLKKTQLEYYFKAEASLKDLYAKSLSLVLYKLQDDQSRLQDVKDKLLGASTDSREVQTVTTETLGADTASHLEWFDLQAYMEGIEEFKKPKAAEVREEKQVVNTKRHELYKVTLDIKDMNSLEDDIKNYLLHTNSHIRRMRKIPLLKQIQIDEALGNILKDSIPSMQKLTQDLIAKRIEQGTLNKITDQNPDDLNRQKALREGFHKISSDLNKEVDQAIKPVQKETAEIFRIIDEVIPLRRDCKKAEAYLNNLIDLNAAQEAWWLASLKFASPTLTSQDTSELILRQIYAVDYITEQIELTEKARAYLASWEDVAERIHLGDKENWTEMRRLRNIAVDLKSNLVRPDVLKTNPIAENIKAILDDTKSYLENANTVITITNPRDPFWNQQEKLELFDELYFRRESLIFLKVVLEHFHHHSSLKFVMTNVSREDSLSSINELLQTIENMRLSVKDQFPIAKVGEQNINDHEQSPNIEEFMARSKQYISQSDGHSSRWWYEFPQTSDMAGVKVGEVPTQAEDQKEGFDPK